MAHLAGIYSVKWKSNRWPLVIFFNLVDVAAIAVYVVWLCNFPNWRIQKCLSHHCLFLWELGETLADDLLRQHLQNSHTLKKAVKSAFVDLGMLDVHQHAAKGEPAAKR